MKPKIAFIGTGGTISSLGAGPLDILDYGATDNRMQADAIATMFPQWAEFADVIPVNFDNVVSHNIYFDAWKKLDLLCDKLVAETPDLAGIVIGHGTASIEETAYFLNLVLKVDVPVVMNESFPVCELVAQTRFSFGRCIDDLCGRIIGKLRPRHFSHGHTHVSDDRADFLGRARRQWAFLEGIETRLESRSIAQRLLGCRIR